MMCGLASVSVNNHDVEMFIRNGVNGFYSSDPEELREFLLYLVQHPSEAEAIGRRGRATAIDLFNHDQYLGSWQQLLREVVG
jgi:spore maturation protein CgeB